MKDERPGRLTSALTLGLLLGVVYAFIAALLLACAGCWRGEEDEEYIYPRRALSQHHAHRQPDSIWTTYDVVYGRQVASRVAVIRNNLPPGVNEGLRVYCTMMPTVTYEHAPPVWAYDLAQYGNMTEALWVAVYENGIRGCDWFLRDVQGNTLPKYRSAWCALNLTEYCPLGVWGDTEGLSCLDWICGPGLDIATGEIAGTAFDGYILEDGPEKHLWHYEWGPDQCIMLGDQCVPKWTYRAAADSCRQRFLDEFVLAAGKRGMLMLTNGHNVLASCSSYDPPMWDALSGCKLEGFGDWGGCPWKKLKKWWEVYRGIEANYGPVHTRKRYDSAQGWDVSVSQIELVDTSDTSMRFVRLMAGVSLMGDGAFSVSPAHDHHGGEPAEGIPPELNQPLGRALMSYQETPDGLLYREFENIEEVTRGALRKVRRRVVVNITDHAIGHVPARDAVWEVLP